MSHWTDDITNVSDAVRQRLRNVAAVAGEDMQVMLIRYATERLLYRISISRYADRFILKGAWLFHVWGISRRATRDVDFLASIPNAAEAVNEVFLEIIGLGVPHDDGLTYDPNSLKAEEIQLDAEYPGVRLRMTAWLGRTTIHTQVDLGFSEAIHEDPEEATLPVLLDFEAPVVRVYSASVVVAEKLEAIVKLGTATTRFKDYFDLFLLSSEKHFDGAMLVGQVSATFAHRETLLPGDVPAGLTNTFAESADSQRQWDAFLRRDGAELTQESFAEVVD